PARHPPDEVDLLAELGIDRPVRRIAAGRDINVLEPNAVGQADADVPRLAIVLPVMLARLLERHAAQDRDAMVHPLTVKLDMGVTVALERTGGEDAVEHLGFLQAEDIRLLFFYQPLDQPDARAHRVDVPRCDLQPL